MKAIYLLLIALALTTGCANPTSYQPADSGSGYGYSEARLDEDKFSVRFIGNGSESAAVVSDYALLRAAEVTLENGFTHFGIVDSRDEAEIGAYTTPVISNTQINPVTGQATTQNYGGITATYSEPRSFVTIVCYKAKPERDNRVVFDADFLKASLREKYELDAMPETQN